MKLLHSWVKPKVACSLIKTYCCKHFFCPHICNNLYNNFNNHNQQIQYGQDGINIGILIAIMKMWGFFGNIILFLLLSTSFLFFLTFKCHTFLRMTYLHFILNILKINNNLKKNITVTRLIKNCYRLIYKEIL